MTAIALVVPGSIETRTGGYEYNRRIAAGLRARGHAVDVIELAGDFPRPSEAALDAAARRLGAIADGATVLVDGLALGAMPAAIEREARRLRLAALVHMPLADESGIDPVLAARLQADERRALSSVAIIVATGTSTAETLACGGLPRDRIAIVEPGTEPAPLARGSGDPSAVHLLCVATVGPGKGHDILAGALAELPSRAWRLTCAGSLDRYPATAEALRDTLQRRRLDAHVSLAGELDGDAVAALYDRADIFVLPTLHESYGMAVAEALSRGLPVVSTTTGAIPDLVGDEAGLLVAPGDAAAFTRALGCVLDDPTRRARLAAGARRVRGRLRTWASAAAAMEFVLAPRR